MGANDMVKFNITSLAIATASIILAIQGLQNNLMSRMTAVSVCDCCICVVTVCGSVFESAPALDC